MVTIHAISVNSRTSTQSIHREYKLVSLIGITPITPRPIVAKRALITLMTDKLVE
jgi:hypothetical protein